MGENTRHILEKMHRSFGLEYKSGGRSWMKDVVLYLLLSGFYKH